MAKSTICCYVFRRQRKEIYSRSLIALTTTSI
nr:MAG TPA: hypothetical protein [Caudoviricetes sp.]